MDFFARVNERLLQPPEPKSSLRSYFEAHLLFQDAYHSPSTSPEASPEPEDRAAKLRTTHGCKKRRHDSDDEGYNSACVERSSKRRRGLGLSVNVAPSPPVTDESGPVSPMRLRRVGTDDSAFHEDEGESGRHVDVEVGVSPPLSLESAATQQDSIATKAKRARHAALRTFISGERSTRSRRLESMKIGKYSLRWTAARARRADG
jgi:hypothetical protein